MSKLDARAGKCKHCVARYLCVSSCAFHSDVGNERWEIHRSVRSMLESGSELWDDAGSSFGTVNRAQDVWQWLQGPVIGVLYADRNAR